MTFNYPKAAATADRLIKKFGMAGAFIRPTKSGEDWNPTILPVQYPCTAARLEYADSSIDGTMIQAGDRMFYVSTSGVSIEPGTADRFSFDSEDYEIIKVKPLSPAGVVVFWEVQARK